MCSNCVMEFYHVAPIIHTHTSNIIHTYQLVYMERLMGQVYKYF